MMTTEAMKNAKKYITLSDRIEKAIKQEQKYEQGTQFNMAKVYKYRNKIQELSKLQSELVLTVEDKEYINSYYSCEIFEI